MNKMGSKITAMRNILFLIVAGLLFLISCTKMDLGKETTIKPQQNYFIDYHTFFRIDSLHDYRCPSDVECIWSGNVDIYFTVSVGSSEINILGQLYSTEHNPVYAGNYTIKIIDVLPHLKTTDQFSLMNEQVKVIINKN
jgi:hypothetical protein